MPEDGTRLARPGDADAIAQVLAEAFLDDPGTIVIDPDPERRAAILPAFFGTWVRAALRDGGNLVVPAGPEVTGVASWFGPERYGPSQEAMARAGLDDVLATFGEAAAARMRDMVGELDRQHDRLAPWPHLRLEFFGVRPAMHGRGIGTTLIEHGHRAADAAGLRCVLETFTEPNVAYYRRRGWDVVHSYTVGGDVPVYFLVRDPRG